MQVEVVRSTRRSRTVALRPTADGVRISIPAWSTQEEEEHYVRTLLRQYEKSQKKSDGSLTTRARTLATRYKLQKPTSIEWAGNQKSRWGSCNPGTGNIRISTDIQPFPQWVRDYVLVHELAHLTYGDHGPKFWALVERYPKTERARGFLIAKGLEELEEEERALNGEPEVAEEVIEVEPPAPVEPEEAVIDLRDPLEEVRKLKELVAPKKSGFFDQMNIFSKGSN